MAGKKLNTIDLLSVPMFIGTMVAEAAYLKNKPKRVLGDMYGATADQLSGSRMPPDELIPLGYERRDTTASLSMLIGNITIAFATAAAISKLDRFVFKHRISNVGSRKGSIVGAMVLWDFLYYWDHRWMHEIRFFWANHVTHHSGERYNLSTALRQPWSGIITAPIFVPLPLLGFPAATSMRAGQLNLLYQYWIHTEAIDRLPTVAEKVLNTPSHHRVHHGANQQYLDKNYGGILIVWDKLFGTFEPEVRRIKYGLTKNIRTYNPFRIAYHEYAELVRDVAKAKGVRNKWNYAFKHPGWKPVEALSVVPAAA